MGRYVPPSIVGCQMIEQRYIVLMADLTGRLKITGPHCLPIAIRDLRIERLVHRHIAIDTERHHPQMQ